MSMKVDNKILNGVDIVTVTVDEKNAANMLRKMEVAATLEVVISHQGKVYASPDADEDDYRQIDVMMLSKLAWFILSIDKENSVGYNLRNVRYDTDVDRIIYDPDSMDAIPCDPKEIQDFSVNRLQMLAFTSAFNNTLTGARDLSIYLSVGFNPTGEADEI